MEMIAQPCTAKQTQPKKMCFVPNVLFICIVIFSAHGYHSPINHPCMWRTTDSTVLPYYRTVLPARVLHYYSMASPDTCLTQSSHAGDEWTMVDEVRVLISFRRRVGFVVYPRVSEQLFSNIRYIDPELIMKYILYICGPNCLVDARCHRGLRADRLGQTGCMYFLCD